MMNNRYKRAFTLVEILVVVSILVLVAALTLPGIRAMQASSGHANAMNTINAALQGVRSYAIMNNVKAAARFQPNGKVAFVYRFTGNDQAKYQGINTNNPAPWQDYPQAGVPNAEGYIYLPVLDQAPLKLPNDYAVANPTRLTTMTTGNNANDSQFWEPFYICYNPDGTMAIQEPIFVALVQPVAGNYQPINPNFDGDNDFAWTPPVIPYGLDAWLDFTQSSADAVETQDVDDRKLGRYFYVARNPAQLKTIFDKNEEVGVDHYAGCVTTGTLTVNSINQIVLFKTSDTWNKLPLFDSTTTTPTKTRYVEDEFTAIGKAPGFVVNPDKYETIFLNPYTGRVIKSME
jgi:prepilin-type N-terminal cleavage/methylation domain-containing protein